MTKKATEKKPAARTAQKNELDKAHEVIAKAAAKQLIELKKTVIKLERILSKVHLLTKPRQ